MAGVERNGLIAFDPMVNEGRKGLVGEEEVEVQHKKVGEEDEEEDEEEEEEEMGRKGERRCLSTLSLF